jgi:hypothetical protein
MSASSENYHLDPEKISLEQFRQSLEARELIPSRLILKENLEERFEVLASAGISNLMELIGSLKSKANVENFSEQIGLPVGYLTILKREASSYFPNPVPLKKFPDVDTQILLKLEKLGLKNSKQLFNAARTNEERQNLCSESGVSERQLMELVHLSDLVRLYGVGPAFARLLYNVGIKSVEAFLKYGPREIVRVYEEETGKKADFAEKDIQFSYEMARELGIIFREQDLSG